MISLFKHPLMRINPSSNRRLNAGLYLLCGILVSARAYGGFNLGDTIDQAQGKIDSIVLPIKDYLAQPVTRPVWDQLQLPEVVNPDNFDFDVDAIALPDSYNQELGQVIVADDFLSYLSLQPEIIQTSIPLFYDDVYRYEDFHDPNAWFVFYNEAGQVVDIEIKSKIKLAYDVINQEGSSVPLDAFGSLNEDLPAGFYFIRVMNFSQYTEEQFYPQPRNNLVDFEFSIQLLNQTLEGDKISGVVIDACDDEPIAQVGVSLDSELTYTYQDGGFQFDTGPTTETQSLFAFAEGYKTGHAWAEETGQRSWQADFRLFPLDGCPVTVSPDEQDSQSTDYRIKLIYDEINELVNFSDVKAIGLPDGEKHIRAQLVKQDNDQQLLFSIAKMEEIRSLNQTVTAVYDYAQSSLFIHEILAGGRRFSVTLEHDRDYVFSVLEVEELN